MEKWQSRELTFMCGTEMKAKLSVLAALAAMLLAGCETPRTDAPAPAIPWPEVTVQAPGAKVRAAAMKTMADRGYVATPAGTNTLLFDRTADLGASAMSGFLHDKDAWRRVRITLMPAGAATRVTASAALVINRGSANEREETDKSEGARQQMQGILERIRDQAQGGS
jgi:hypothetical protein